MSVCPLSPSLLLVKNFDTLYASPGLATAEVRLYLLVQLHELKTIKSRTPSVLCILAGIPKSAFITRHSVSFQNTPGYIQCYIQTDNPTECRPQGNDYLECLHHTKQVRFAFFSSSPSLCPKLVIRNNVSRLSEMNFFVVSNLRRMQPRSKGMDMQNN
jgi:hypothetical protein